VGAKQIPGCSRGKGKTGLNENHSAPTGYRIARYGELAAASDSSPLKLFAQRHRLKVTRDECSDQIIRGKHGDLSDACDGEHLCAAFWGNGPKFSRLRARRIRLALGEKYGDRWAGGVGGDEAVILFSPVDQRSALFFIRALGIHRKRRVSSEVIGRLQSFAQRPTTTAARTVQAQAGQVIRIGDRWYLRYWERRNVGGNIERKRVTHQLGPVTTRGKRPPADIVAEAERHISTINSGTIPADRIVTISDFLERVYLPWVELHKHPSTLKGYRDIWEDHLKPICGQVWLEDTRTYHVQAGWAKSQRPI
jgi:hypothetical protein